MYVSTAHILPYTCRDVSFLIFFFSFIERNKILLFDSEQIEQPLHYIIRSEKICDISFHGTQYINQIHFSNFTALLPFFHQIFLIYLFFSLIGS